MLFATAAIALILGGTFFIINARHQNSKVANNASSPRRVIRPPIVDSATLEKWGFRGEETTAEIPQDSQWWDHDAHHPVGLRIQGVKSIEKMKDMEDNYFPAYLLVEEVYENETEAEARMGKGLLPPGHLRSKMTPHTTLRKAFRVENRVLFVSTSATLYSNTLLDDLFARMEKHFRSNEEI